MVQKYIEREKYIEGKSDLVGSTELGDALNSAQSFSTHLLILMQRFDWLIDYTLADKLLNNCG